METYVILEIANCLYIVPAKSIQLGDVILFHGSLSECESMVTNEPQWNHVPSITQAEIESAVNHPYS